MSDADSEWVCINGLYTGWRDVFYCTDPNSWAYFGIASSLFFSIMGAAV